MGSHSQMENAYKRLSSTVQRFCFMGKDTNRARDKRHASVCKNFGEANYWNGRKCAQLLQWQIHRCSVWLWMKVWTPITLRERAAESREKDHTDWYAQVTLYLLVTYVTTSFCMCEWVTERVNPVQVIALNLHHYYYYKQAQTSNNSATNSKYINTE